jgi:hypothetical protein
MERVAARGVAGADALRTQNASSAQIRAAKRPDVVISPHSDGHDLRCRELIHAALGNAVPKVTSTAHTAGIALRNAQPINLQRPQPQVNPDQDPADLADIHHRRMKLPAQVPA